MTTLISNSGTRRGPFSGLRTPKPLTTTPIDCIAYEDVRALASSRLNGPQHPIFDIVRKGRFAPVRSFILPIEAINQNKRAKQDEAIEWSLPAHGDKGHECGRFVPNTGIVVCPDGHVIKGRTYRCERLDCPECYRWSVLRSAERVANSLRAAYRLYDQPVLNHIVVSPPQKEAKATIGTKRGYDTLRHRAVNIAQDLGVLGGTVICHPWRQNGEKDETEIESIEDGKVSHDSTWRLAPHFHIVGMGFVDVSKVAQLYKTHGWVVKVLSFDVEPSRLESVLAYCLSHVGVGHVEGHAYNLRASNPFGVCAPTKITKVADFKTTETETCPCCGRTLQDYKAWMDFIEYGTEPRDATRVKHTLVYCKRSDRHEVAHLVSEMNREELLICAIHDPRLAVVNPWRPKDIEVDTGPPSVVPSPCSGSLLSYLRG